MQNIIIANVSRLQEDVLPRLSNVETSRRDVRTNRPDNYPAVPDVYDRQFSIPQKCILDSLGQQFLVHDNGQPNHIILLEQTKVFDSLAIYRTGFWIEHLN